VVEDGCGPPSAWLIARSRDRYVRAEKNVDAQRLEKPLKDGVNLQR